MKNKWKADWIKVGAGVALLVALTGCVGYVGGGYGGDVVVGGPVVVGGVWDAGFVGRDVAHGYSRRGAASRGFAHGGGGRGGGGGRR
jgi:anaerobic selenocysteine-containing dehydrogenase